MKKFYSRVLSVCLAFAMCVSMLVIPASAASFTDVSSSAWYYEAVVYCSENGLMNGYGNGKFGPTDTLTRAMFVQVLYNLSSDYGTYKGQSSGFSDVSDSAWYAEAIAWARATGVTTGTSSTTFSPTQAVTREQVAVFISNYLEVYGIDLEELDSVVSSFQDASSVSSWAKSAVEEMRLLGIFNGDDTGCFNPKNSCTRAEAAQVFMNLNVRIEDVTNHDHTYGSMEIQDPTCTDYGYFLYTCTICGYEYITGYILNYGHSYYLDSVTDGIATYVCSRCGEAYDETFAVTDDNLNEVKAIILDYRDSGLWLSYGTWNVTTIINITFVPAGSISTSDLTWTSSDSSVIQMNSDGSFKTIGNGEATLTATAPNGVSASVVVKVVNG